MVRTGMSSAQDHEYQRRRDFASLFVAAGGSLNRVWWPAVDATPAQVAENETEAQDALEALTTAVHAESALAVTVMEDVLLAGADALSEMGVALEGQVSHAAEVERRRAHSGALMLRVLNDADEDEFPEDIEHRGTESLALVASGIARNRWNDVVFGTEWPAGEELLDAYTRAAVDVLATFIAIPWFDTLDEDILEQAVAPPGAYPEVLRGGAYPGW